MTKHKYNILKFIWSDILQYFISHYNKESEITFPEDFIIYDTTLRDGEQTPGVCFSLSDTMTIISFNSGHVNTDIRINSTICIITNQSSQKTYPVFQD